jgi:uncharacterized protein (TIGR03435 family)
MRISVVSATILAAGRLFGQSPAPPAFEVASVKPSGPQDRAIMFATYPGGRIGVSLYTLEMLVEEAFDLQAFQVVGGPTWMRQDRFNIEAKPPATSASSKANPPYAKAPPNAEQRQMLQTLLADRFALKSHRETKEGPIYLLVRGKKPLKLQDAKNKDDFPWVGSPNDGMVRGDGVAGINASMPLLAVRLSRYLRRPVIDQTHIEGAFDFRVELAGGPGPGVSKQGTISPDSTPNQADVRQDDLVYSILTSVLELGLKLEPAKGPVESLVIEYAEKPSAN